MAKSPKPVRKKKRRRLEEDADAPLNSVENDDVDDVEDSDEASDAVDEDNTDDSVDDGSVDDSADEEEAAPFDIDASETENEPEPAPEPVPDWSAGAIEPADPSVELAEEDLLAHLQCLDDYGALTVTQFSQYAQIHSVPQAKNYLDEYVRQGVVRRHWENSKGRYSLSPSGESRLKSLKG